MQKSDIKWGQKRKSKCKSDARVKKKKVDLVAIVAGIR